MAEEDEIDKLTSSWNSHDRWAIMRRLAEIARAERVRASQLADALRNLCDALGSTDVAGPRQAAFLEDLKQPFAHARSVLAAGGSSTQPEATK